MPRILFIALLMTSLQCCWANENAITHVFVSILPQKYFVQRIGGSYVNVSVMVGTNHSPELYMPSPKQIALLQQAQLYFRIGIPFEDAWIDSIKKLNNDLHVIECCKEIEFRHFEKYNTDPHIWTNPVNAKHIAWQITQALVKILPAHKKEFMANYSVLIMDLNRLDKYIKSRLDGMKQRYIIGYHPAWGHYATQYNLIQLTIEQHSHQPRAKSLSELIEFAQQNNIRRIFVQPQFGKNYASIVANQIDAKLIELDPLAEDYIANLYYVTDIIAGE